MSQLPQGLLSPAAIKLVHTQESGCYVVNSSVCFSLQNSWHPKSFKTLQGFGFWGRNIFRHRGLFRTSSVTPWRHQAGKSNIDSVFRLYTRHLFFTRENPIRLCVFSPEQILSVTLKNELLCAYVLFKGIFSWCTDLGEEVELLTSTSMKSGKQKLFRARKFLCRSLNN